MSLDRLLFVVSNVPWQKVGERQISPAEARVAMVQAAIAAHPGFELSRVEIDRGGDSFMAETLVALQEQNPDSELFLILGADAAAGIPTWRHAQTLAELATLVVLERPGASEFALHGFRVERVSMPGLAISSTELRERWRAGRSVDWLIPEAVQSVLTAWQLYRGQP